MGKPRRANLGGMLYHVLNRANGKAQIFREHGDYGAFLAMVCEAQEKVSVRLLHYCVMPNHWHFVLWPEADGDLSRFMHWLTDSHAHRWQVFHDVLGFGHVYQGRFKSFPIQNDRHFLTVARYVERNPVRARLVKRAEEWPWSSAGQRASGKREGRPVLTSGPVELPAKWLEMLNTEPDSAETDAVRASISRGRPFGEDSWTLLTAHLLGIESVLRPRGRPRKR